MGVSEELPRECPKKLTLPIDFVSMKNVPESHTWSENSTNLRENQIELTSINAVPVIDFNDPNVMEKIFEACQTWGMFQLTNHGISNQLFEDVNLQAKKLFDLPLDEKKKVLRSEQGIAGYGAPRFGPFFEKLMWHEGFSIMGNSLLDHAKVLWPNDYEKFCDVMEKYQAEMKAIAIKLSESILKSLGAPESEMSWFKNDPDNISTVLQLNSYPPCPEPSRTMGLADHTDSIFLTIVHQSGANGLQVFKDGASWVQVDAVPGALIVNVGDLLHIISNGRLHSVLHRAVPSEKHRISVAYFVGPPLDFQLNPFVDYPGCEGPKLKSMTVKEYMGIKAKLFTPALSSIRL